MAFSEVLLTLTQSICILILFMLFTWTIYRNITRTDLPPGFKLRLKIQILDTLSTCVLNLDSFLGEHGICQDFAILRYAFDASSLWQEDSNLIIKDLVFDDVPVRVYWPKTPVAGRRRGMLYLHGGIGLIGSIQAYERVCRCIAQESDSVVVSVGFRLAPEHLFPAQISDCLTAAIHFLKHAKNYGVDSHRIIIGGDSSGGTYSAAIAQELVTRVDLPRLRGQILIYPFLQALDFNLPSYQQYHSGPFLKKQRAIQLGFRCFGRKIADPDAIMKNAHVSQEMRMKYSKWVSADLIPAEFKVTGCAPPELAPFSEELYDACKPVFETRFSPLLAEDAVIRQLPETLLLICEYDALRDDGLLYKKRLEDNGVPVTWHLVKDGFHGIAFLINLPFIECESSRNSLKQIIHFLEGL